MSPVPRNRRISRQIIGLVGRSIASRYDDGITVTVLLVRGRVSVGVGSVVDGRALVERVVGVRLGRGDPGEERVGVRLDGDGVDRLAVLVQAAVGLEGEKLL